MGVALDFDAALEFGQAGGKLALAFVPLPSPRVLAGIKLLLPVTIYTYRWLVAIRVGTG